VGGKPLNYGEQMENLFKSDPDFLKEPADYFGDRANAWFHDDRPPPNPPEEYDQTE
jgi:hypothetical protein